MGDADPYASSDDDTPAYRVSSLSAIPSLAQVVLIAEYRSAGKEDRRSRSRTWVLSHSADGNCNHLLDRDRKASSHRTRQRCKYPLFRQIFDLI